MDLTWQHDAAGCPVLCLNALVPVLIRKERVVMEGVVKALRVLLGRRGCCEKKENFSLHKEPLR